MEAAYTANGSQALDLTWEDKPETCQGSRLERRRLLQQEAEASMPDGWAVSPDLQPYVYGPELVPTKRDESEQPPIINATDTSAAPNVSHTSKKKVGRKVGSRKRCSRKKKADIKPWVYRPVCHKSVDL